MMTRKIISQLHYTIERCSVLGLGNLDQAEEYLLQAQWTVLNTRECPNTIRHKLSRHLGLLYAAKSQFSHALRQLAYDVSSFVDFYLNLQLCVSTST